MFLLGLVYVVFVGVLFAAGASGVLIAVIAVALLLVQLFTSDKIALATMGAKEVSPDQEPELHGIIERLCVQADLPKPRICVMDTSMPNAFAMGRSQKSATVCATSGILRMLEPAELEGVMAHELTHVINRDVHGHDARELLRDARLADRPVHALLRRRLRRRLRAQPGRGGGDDAHPARLRDRLRDLLPAAAERSRATASSPPTAARPC